MKLKNSAQADIPLDKLHMYLLSETHPIGKSKAKYFQAAGFNKENVHLLKEGLLSLIRSEDIKDEIRTPHGVKYVVDGMLKTLEGRFLRVRTVWIVDKGGEMPRFVTAYPL